MRQWSCAYAHAVKSNTIGHVSDLCCSSTRSQCITASQTWQPSSRCMRQALRLLLGTETPLMTPNSADVSVFHEAGKWAGTWLIRFPGPICQRRQGAATAWPGAPPPTALWAHTCTGSSATPAGSACSITQPFTHSFLVAYVHSCIDSRLWVERDLTLVGVPGH